VFGKAVLRGGPVLEKTEWHGNGELRLHFLQSGGKLIALDSQSPGGFTLAGEDGVFHPATAEILSESTVRVSSNSVPAPVHLRYAWQNNPVDASLYNLERLPASPFEVRKPLQQP